MKIASIALFASLTATADATGFRDLVEKVTHRHTESAAAETTTAIEGADQENRELQNQNGCWNNKNTALAWHPNYSAGWTNGICHKTVDCNSPSYSSELACCKGAYSGQTSGFCLNNLPSPPTMSPTVSGGLDVFYPDYSQEWSSGLCVNTRPLPSGRPNYSTMLACCKGAYRGQTSGYCLGQLPSPPTMSPTETGGLDVFYPDYSQQWVAGLCINTRPLPSGRPNYSTMLACCKGAYAGQMSGYCLSQLPSPPTGAPTTSDFETDFWYPEYEKSWSDAGCSNKLPLPFNNKGDRPNYKTQLTCCKMAYGGQTSGVCLGQLPSPPTMTPTGSGGVDFWYPDYDTSWSDATCLNTRPLPFGTGGRPTYDSMLACCKGAYAGQSSGACLASLPNPPTQSPTTSGGLDIYYPNYVEWSSGKCVNDRPLPSGRPNYSTQQACCSGAYGGQTSNNCMCDAVGVCYSCNCGTEAERTSANCDLNCGSGD